jgi:hypothetical protein
VRAASVRSCSKTDAFVTSGGAHGVLALTLEPLGQHSLFDVPFNSVSIWVHLCRAALDFAMQRGISHEGWCPRGCLAEDGPSPPITN